MTQHEMGEMEDLTSLLREVKAAFCSIDRFMLTSEYVQQKFPEVSGGTYFPSSKNEDSLRYLQDEDIVLVWDDYFRYVMEEWDADRMSTMTFNSIIERLSSPAAILDDYTPQLSQKYRSLRNVPPGVVAGICDRHSCVNSFLNSADEGLELYFRRDDPNNNHQPRSRRPIPHLQVRTFKSPIPTKESFTSGSPEPSTRRPNFLKLVVNNNAACISITIVLCILSGILQVHSFDLSNQTRGSTPGTVLDPDFYSTLQNSLMQLLGLYTALLPFMRQGIIRNQYQSWAGGLSFGSAAFSIAASVVYVFFPALAPLLGFAGTACQAMVVLQLVFAVDGSLEEARGEVKKVV